jgi:hypothetical protein
MDRGREREKGGGGGIEAFCKEFQNSGNISDCQHTNNKNNKRKRKKNNCNC